jgi:hypothetical protein
MKCFITIRGQRQYRWRVVDQDGDVIDLHTPAGKRAPDLCTLHAHASVRLWLWCLPVGDSTVRVFAVPVGAIAAVGSSGTWCPAARVP